MARGPEGIIEADMMRLVTEMGGYAEKYQSGAGTGKGRPDLRLVYGDGICTAVEVKRKQGNYPTLVQIKNLHLLAKNGARALVANDALQLVQFMQAPHVKHDFVQEMQINDSQMNAMTVKQAREIWTKRPMGCSIVRIIAV